MASLFAEHVVYEKSFMVCMASKFAELVDFMVCMASNCFDCTSFNLMCNFHICTGVYALGFNYHALGLTTIYSQLFTLMYGFSGIECTLSVILIYG